VISLSLAEQSAAAFLDERLLGPQVEGVWFTWEQFEKAAAPAQAGELAYILHAGHCGSTLLSRLVESAASGRPLREPLPLRLFAAEAASALDGASLLTREERARRLRIFERVWSRGSAVIKATGICNNLVDELDPGAPIAFAYLKPEVYIVKRMGGAGARLDLRGFAQQRFRRLRSFTDAGEHLGVLSVPQLTALSWLVEMAAIASSKRDVLTVDFDEFLKDPAQGLSDLCAHFRLPAAPGAVEAAVRGDIMRQYSKLPSHAYDKTTRAQILAEDRARYKNEIADGLKWLERVARTFPAGERALNRFG
jgi:hypothetical protein